MHSWISADSTINKHNQVCSSLQEEHLAVNQKEYISTFKWLPDSPEEGKRQKMKLLGLISDIRTPARGPLSRGHLQEKKKDLT